MEKSKIKTYVWLLTTNLFISAFTFGGGYLIIPVVRRFFVVKKHLFTEEEFSNMAAVAQSSPGAIAINLSALAGYRAAGIGGALISCFAAILPPLVLLTLISAFYQRFISNGIIAAVLKGMEAGVAAIMVDLIVDLSSLILKKKSVLLSAMVPLSFIANFVLGINAALILLSCCFFCILQVLLQRRNQT